VKSHGGNYNLQDKLTVEYRKKTKVDLTKTDKIKLSIMLRASKFKVLKTKMATLTEQLN